MARRMLALFTALVLVTSLTLAVFADTWDLKDGDITVSANESGQTVAQGETSKPDNSPTITGGTGNQTITVTTTSNAEANLTIKDVNAKTIDVDSSNATINVEGNNKVSNNNNYPGIHVKDGNLTITGDGSLDVSTLNGPAAIGSQMVEDMSGSITIEDNVNVTATSYGEGAAIGSGCGGAMSGTITIGDTATVKASAEFKNFSSGSVDTYNRGAGIGSGCGGDMSGTIAISNKATVIAKSDDSSSDHIGAGMDGKFSGTIQYFDPPEDPQSGKDTKTTALYRVVDDKGISTGYKSELKEGVLTITVARPDANLTGTLAGLKTLTRWGVETIVFETESATSTFTLADLIAQGEEKAPFRLTHKGEEVTLTLNGEPLENILK